jgi:O-antigen/teichoic acid export membrane protein
MAIALASQIRTELTGRSNIVFHSFAYLFNRGLPFVASLLVAQFLPVADFGRYITVINLFVSLCLIVDMGFALATAKTVARRGGDDPEAAGSVVMATLLACTVLGLVMAAAIVLGAGQLTHFVLADPSLEMAVLAGALYVPASALASTATAALQGAQRYRPLAIAGFIGGIVFLTLVLIAAIEGDALLVIWAASLGAAARALALIVTVAPLVRPVARGSHLIERLKRDLRELWQVALPASLAALTFAPVNTFMMAMLYRSPNGAVEAGWLGLALQFFSVVMVTPGMLTQYALPKFAASAGEDSGSRRRAQLRRFTLLATAVCLCMVAPIGLAAPLLLQVLAPEYAGGAPALRWMMVAALISAPQGVFSNYLIALSQNWIRVVTRLLWAAVVVGCVIAFPTLDARGMAVAYAVAWAAILASQMIVVARIERAD